MNNPSSDSDTQHLQAELHRLQVLLIEKDIAINEGIKIIHNNQKTIAEKDACIQEKDSNIKRLQQESLRQKEEIASSHDEIESLSQEIHRLKEQLRLLLSKRYKSQSEQLKYLQGQLFDEAELEQAISETQQKLDELEKQAKRTAPKNEDSERKEKVQPKRTPLPEHYRRVDIEIDVSDEDKQAMGDDWECIGFDIAEQLAVSQREYYVKQIKRKKYVRKNTDQPSPFNADIKVAPTAKVLLPKAIADATLLADLLTSKFVDGMSFYRTHKRLVRDGVDIGYSTLCNFPIQIYEQLEAFRPLFYDEAAKSSVWHLDETTLQVLDEPGRKNQQKSYIWALRSGPPDKPLVLFHYDERRNYTALENWLRPCLEHFNGVIVTDEHKPYNTLRENYPNIQGHGGCWYHCRRKFVDASKGRKSTSDAHRIVNKIAMLTKREQSIAHLSGEEKCRARHEQVKPYLEDIKNTLDAISDKYPHKGLMRTAIGYALNHWHKLTAFLNHANMPMDNNAVENAIRPFTIGRKNFLFAGSPKGAHASAFMYSLIESAKANGLEPLRYLTALFEQYPLAKTKEERRALLPTYFQFSK